jgi:hypothetical protein
MPDSTQETQDHIAKVQARLQTVISALTVRAAHHDRSKLSEPEKSTLDAKAGALGALRYGTPEYAAAMAAVDMQPFLDHHYAHNDHHPQHYEDGVNGMSLLSILEMQCDWAAAGERVKEGSMAQSLEVNRTRFGLSDQLYAILVNTAKELGWY